MRLLLLITIFIFIVPFSNAHLEGGSDVVVNGYLLDFGYEPANLEVGKNSILAFNLVNETTEEIIVPESVWVRISKGDKIFFAGTFFPEAKNVNFAYIFPEPGDYEIKARFKEGDVMLAEHVFDVRVSGFNAGLALMAFGIVSVILAFVAIRYVRK